jgi:hypothetical protein
MEMWIASGERKKQWVGEQGGITYLHFVLCGSCSCGRGPSPELRSFMLSASSLLLPLVVIVTVITREILESGPSSWTSLKTLSEMTCSVLQTDVGREEDANAPSAERRVLSSCRSSAQFAFVSRRSVP